MASEFERIVPEFTTDAAPVTEIPRASPLTVMVPELSIDMMLPVLRTEMPSAFRPEVVMLPLLMIEPEA